MRWTLSKNWTKTDFPPFCKLGVSIFLLSKTCVCMPHCVWLSFWQYLLLLLILFFSCFILEVVTVLPYMNLSFSFLGLTLKFCSTLFRPIDGAVLPLILFPFFPPPPHECNCFSEILWYRTWMCLPWLFCYLLTSFLFRLSSLLNFNFFQSFFFF